MRAEYCVEPVVDVHIDSAAEIPDKVHLDGADIYFKISEKNLLKKITVVYTGLQIKIEHGGGADGKGKSIILNYPEVHGRAIKAMSFIFNYIHSKIGMSAFDIARLKNIEPTVSPETQEEEECWSKYRKVKKIISVFRIVHGSIDAINLNNLRKQFVHAKAYANFADAKNAQNPITKYESLYKVVESFFDGTGLGFDQNVSNFMIKFDSNFTPKHFEELRQLRNRCVHSKDKNHVTSGDVELLEEVSGKTEKLERIAELLLKHK